MSADLRDLQVGDMITVAFDDDTPPIRATIRRFQSDEQEGLGPEIEDYIACWVDVQAAGAAPAPLRTISLGTDLQYYLDGRRVTLTRQ